MRRLENEKPKTVTASISAAVIGTSSTKTPKTGQWRSKTTGKTNYNDAKEFKREFMDSLKGQYNPSNDRLKFTEAADAYIEHRGVAAAAGTVRLEKERLRALKKLLAQIAVADLKLRTSMSS